MECVYGRLSDAVYAGTSPRPLRKSLSLCTPCTLSQTRPRMYAREFAEVSQIPNQTREFSWSLNRAQGFGNSRA